MPPQRRKKEKGNVKKVVFKTDMTLRTQEETL